ARRFDRLGASSVPMASWWRTFWFKGPAAPAHLVKGERGERAAARHLRRQGYKILTRRFAGKHGEIDLVAREGEVLAFVEVKTRASDEYGDAASAVDREKRRHLVSCAREYLRLLNNPRVPVRFDVVEVYLDDDAREPREVRLIRGAFAMPEHISD
ncbi:MAG: YraN family protein, partial [Verrucomicrobiae bacterium]|nr:YraN family protein [Verrucomicrobiae bacterium]